MALIVRIDVDRPYGKQPLPRHLLSRMSSDFYFPVMPGFGYLLELKRMLQILNRANAKSYAFFRKCTLPSKEVLDLMRDGDHEIGLHLENSRSEKTFFQEKENLERHTGQTIRSVSKHGSGSVKYGYRHYAPYEPERYLDWARKAGMKLFLGNLEDPTLEPQTTVDGFVAFPSAFWLEPHWRDTQKFTENWLMTEASNRDVVMLVHPENVLDDSELTGSFTRLVSTLETKILP